MPARLVALFFVCLGALLCPQERAEACSIATDFATPPDNEHPYSAENAPDAPTILDAYVSHSYADDGPGCSGISSCGDIHGLNLVVRGVEENQLLRIVHEDESITYASAGYADGEGNRKVFIYGYDDVATDIFLRIAVIDEDGYPSLETEVEALDQGGDDGSCSAGGSRASNLSSYVLVLFGLMLRRRRSKQRA